MDSSYPIGIDLGTSQSLIGVWQNGGVQVIPNDQGNRSTPSYVAFTSPQKLIGDTAKNLAIGNTQIPISNAKNVIGRKFDDQDLQQQLKNWPFKVVNNHQDKPIFQVEYEGQQRNFYPEEITAMILQYLKQQAEQYLGTNIKDVVISIPGVFNDSQRQATLNAGIIAGFNVMRLINEPLAAAMASSFNKQNQNEQLNLIFDLGGGKLDVSLICSDYGIYEVIETSGYANLGGEDFDTRLIEYCKDQFLQKTGIDFSKNERCMRIIRRQCERAKRILSSATQAVIEIDAFYETTDFSCIITRSRFEELCMPLFIQCINAVEKVINASKRSKKEIADVVLVGGSSRIPRIQNMLSDYFSGKVLNMQVNPDEAIVFGATVQAAILSCSSDPSLTDILTIDVLSHAIWLQSESIQMSLVINKTTSIPCKKTTAFKLVEQDNKQVIQFEVFEENIHKTQCFNKLGTFLLQIQKIGLLEIQLAFNINPNGILNITVDDKSIPTESYQYSFNRGGLTELQINSMMNEIAQPKAQDTIQFEKFVQFLQGLLNDEFELSKFADNDQQMITELVKNLTEWFELNKLAGTQQLRIKQMEYFLLLDVVIQKAFCNQLFKQLFYQTKRRTRFLDRCGQILKLNLRIKPKTSIDKSLLQLKK